MVFIGDLPTKYTCPSGMMDELLWNSLGIKEQAYIYFVYIKGITEPKDLMAILMFEKYHGFWKLKQRVQKVLNANMHNRILMDKETEFQKDMVKLRQTVLVATKRKILKKYNML